MWVCVVGWRGGELRDGDGGGVLWRLFVVCGEWIGGVVLCI